MKAKQRCPHCNVSITINMDKKWHPFCSERCRLIDLGAWLDGSHRISEYNSVDENHNNNVDSTKH